MARNHGHGQSPQEALARTIGPDNVIHTTELDAIPCAGIRVSNGPFSGLLAWRFVVRLHHKSKLHNSSRGPNGFGGSGHTRSRTLHAPKRPNERRKRRMTVDGLGLFTPSRPKQEQDHGRSSSETEYRTRSATSLGQGNSETKPATGSSSALSVVSDISSEVLALGSSSSTTLPSSVHKISPSIVTNFLLDTSSSYNFISRTTLEALGVDETSIKNLEKYQVDERGRIQTISLYLQDLDSPITFQMGADGEPGRLGVQFLDEARVNVCIGEGGRGGILWVDSPAQTEILLQGDIPRTIPLPKLNLQARVRALFGLQSP